MDALKLGKLTAQLVKIGIKPEQIGNIVKLLAIYDYIARWNQRRKRRMWLRMWLKRN